VDAALLAQLCIPAAGGLSAGEATMLIDDRSSGSYRADPIGNHWRLVTDTVMGGVSEGTLSPDEVAGRACLRLHGVVRLENRGGFIQAALDLDANGPLDASDYTGLVIEVFGNNESYNLHLRQSGMWLPWQAYRSTFVARPRWQTVYLPFEAFKAHRTDSRLKTNQLRRIGLVAIGRGFQADICLARIGLHRRAP
jgi:hypothetical protein